jgi:ketosteroid isomerase-like protein
MTIPNVSVVQKIYAAFGRGDVPAVQEHVVESTHWDFNGARHEVPWHSPVDGRSRLPGFFQALGNGVDMHAFAPREFIHCGPHVVVDVHIEYTVRTTGRRVVQDQIHWWTFDEAHRVLRLRHFEDTAQVLAAVTARDASHAPERA